MLKEKLLSLNFTPNQADVYLALLEEGESKVGPLIKKTSFHRNLVYRALDDLIKIKLVSRITRKGVFYYKIIDPSSLLHSAQEKLETTKDIIKQIKSVKQKSKSELFVLSGRQGIIDLYEMMIEENADIYLLGATFDFPEKFQNYTEKLIPKLEKKGIKTIILAQAVTKNIPKTPLISKVKRLPKEFPPSPHVTWICGEIVANVIWETPEAIFVIKNKRIADNYRAYFNLLWKKTK